ncbi:MAG: hypothetical protein IJ795_08400 [Bacteroidales bacterium]|nr:hypothetical protein [Bacteroidales bacterium]
MKDLVIRGKSLRRELFILLGCLAAAIATNIGAIIYYERPWSELFTQVGFMLTLALCLYAALWAVRLAVFIIVLIFKKLF